MIVKPISWAEAIAAAEHELLHSASKDARLNAELLAAHVLGVWSRSEVREQANRHLSQQDLDFYRSLIRRRMQHEPLQYITGETEFFGLRLYCSPVALIPRPDTEILVEEALKVAAERSGDVRILDIGTGSGCIALAIASKLPNATVIGIDVSADALTLAEKNRKRCSLEHVEFIEADIHDQAQVEALGRFDIIVSNPPYVPLSEYQMLEQEVRDFEPRNALTDEGNGLSFYEEIVRVTPMLLRHEGRLLVEIGYGALEAITGLDSDLSIISVSKDLSDIDRVIVFAMKQ